MGIALIPETVVPLRYDVALRYRNSIETASPELMM
jgi:hypothetical protein